MSSKLFDVVVKQADKSPHNIALCCADENLVCLSYLELIQAATKLQSVLVVWLENLDLFDKANQTTPLILLKLDRNASILIGILGVFGCNAAYVPIDPEHPRKRQTLIAENSGARIAIVSETILSQKMIDGHNDKNEIDDCFQMLGFGNNIRVIIVIDYTGSIVYIKDMNQSNHLTQEFDSFNCQPNHHKNSPFNHMAFSEQENQSRIAYVTYTSGSTGTPKGVIVGVRALLITLVTFQDLFRLNHCDCMLAVTTYTFDISILELLFPLTVGACVCIAPLKLIRNAGLLANLLNNDSNKQSSIKKSSNSLSSSYSSASSLPPITIMQATPALWRMLVCSGWEGKDGLQVLCGGDSFPVDILCPLVDKCRCIYNLYGPTEATIWCFIYKLELIDHKKSDNHLKGVVASHFPFHHVPIGRPMDNTTYKIMRRRHSAGGRQVGAMQALDFEEVGDGDAGELFIGGSRLCLGYTEEALTTLSFVKQFNDDSSLQSSTGINTSEVETEKEVFYPSGDLVIQHPVTKMIYFIQRINDEQVKVNGYRIEVGDVESSILQNIKTIYLQDQQDMPSSSSSSSSSSLSSSTNSHVNILDCAVVAIPSSSSSNKLVAFVLLSSIMKNLIVEDMNSCLGSTMVLPRRRRSRSRKDDVIELSSLQFQSFLQQSLLKILPKYMIPNHFHFYIHDEPIKKESLSRSRDKTGSLFKYDKSSFLIGKQLPRNVNNKVDRSFLHSFAKKLSILHPQGKKISHKIIRFEQEDDRLVKMCEIVKYALYQVLFEGTGSSSVDLSSTPSISSMMDIDENLEFESFGITSMVVIEFFSFLSQLLSNKYEISPSILMTHNTPISLAQYLSFDRNVLFQDIDVELVPHLTSTTTSTSSPVSTFFNKQHPSHDVLNNHHGAATQKHHPHQRTKNRQQKQKTQKQVKPKTTDIGIEACKEGNLKLVRQLLEVIEPFTDDEEAKRLKMMATCGTHLNQRDAVMQRTMPWDVETVDRFGSPGLHWAASGGHLEVCKILVEIGKANPHRKDTKSGRSALHWAARQVKFSSLENVILFILCFVCQGQMKVAHWLVEEQGLSVHESTNVRDFTVLTLFFV